MTENDHTPEQRLRLRAQARLAQVEDVPADISSDEIQSLLLELQIHHVELEIQNEELLKTQADLEASRDSYAQLFDLAPVGYVTLDKGLVIVNANLQASTLMGTERLTLVGSRITDFIRPEDQDAFYLFSRKILPDSSPPPIEIVMLRQKQFSFDAQVSGAPGVQTGSGAGLWSCTISDVSALATAKREKLRSERLASIGLLAGGVAHHFNNGMQVILGFTELAMQPDCSFRDREEFLVDIQKSAEHATELTRRLLAFGQRQLLQPKPIDLATIIREHIPMLRRMIGENISLELTSQEKPHTVNADPAEIMHILSNLCLNARDALPDRGRVDISLENVSVDDSAQASGPSAKSGRFVRLKVRDSGVGMSEETRRHAFEPFYTTKPIADGPEWDSQVFTERSCSMAEPSRFKALPGVEPR